jgi:hypothetical protein
MKQARLTSLRSKAAKWTCNQLAITNHHGDTAALLRKLADTIDELGAIDILSIAYRDPPDPANKEVTVSLYFSLVESSARQPSARQLAAHRKAKRASKPRTSGRP